MSPPDGTKTSQTHKRKLEDPQQGANTESDAKRVRASTMKEAKEEFRKADDATRSLNRELNRPFEAANTKMREIETEIAKLNEALKAAPSDAKKCNEREELIKAHGVQKEIYLKRLEDGINTTDVLTRCIKLRVEESREQSNIAKVEGYTKELQNIQKEMNILIGNVKKLGLL